MKLDANGLGDIKLIVPDNAGGFTNYFNSIIQDSLVMSKVAHWGVHNYGGGSGGEADAAHNEIPKSIYPTKNYWVTEFIGIHSALDIFSKNPGAEIVWDGFDTVYHHGTRNGLGSLPGNDSKGIDPPLVSYDLNSKTYSPRKSLYEHAQLFKFVEAGASQLKLSNSDNNLDIVAFTNANGQLVIVAHNDGGGGGGGGGGGNITLNGTITNFSGATSLIRYETSGTLNLAKGTDVKLNNNAFSTSIESGSTITLLSPTSSTSVVKFSRIQFSIPSRSHSSAQKFLKPNFPILLGILKRGTRVVNPF